MKTILPKSKTKAVESILGTLFILMAVALAMLYSCPSKAQYFVIYTLVGIGIAFLFSKSAEKTKTDIKTWNITVVLTGAVALPFILFYSNPIGNFKTDTCDVSLSKTSVTVFVHGIRGKQDMILRQKGSVIMDVGAERKKASINENGQAFFQNLHFGDSARLNIDFSEPYKATYPDSVYVINFSNNIYLEVALEGIDKVEGRVIYKELPLQGVVVAIDDLVDTSDSRGRFKLTIPVPEQKQEYQVWFSKAGFKTKSVSAFPQTKQSIEILMDK